MLINSSTSPRSSTVTQPTIRPWSSATRTSSARTLFGSCQAAESRLTSVKTDSERTVPNPTSSSSSTEEVAISTIAGMSRRFAARIWILALVRATAMDRSTRFFLFLCADARLQAAGRDHHEDKDDESPGEGDDLPAARGHLKGGNLGPVSAVLLVEVLQHPFGRAPHVTDSKDQQTEREDQCGKHRSAPRRAPEILRVEVAHHEVEDRTQEDRRNPDARDETIRERDELEHGVLSRRHADPRDRRSEDHHGESEASYPQDGGGDMREADDELEDVGHARGNPRPADELVDVFPACTPTNPACRRHRRGCPRGPRGRRNPHRAREAGRRWRRAEATARPLGPGRPCTGRGAIGPDRAPSGRWTRWAPFRSGLSESQTGRREWAASPEHKPGPPARRSSSERSCRRQSRWTRPVRCSSP